jgi:hypothetical protein
MGSGASATSRVPEEWSVTLNGRYVVRFRGANAQELATRQLHELAELLGFNDAPRSGPSAADGSSGPDGITPGAVQRHR